MKITKVRIYLCDITGRYPVLGELVTDEGLSGVGESGLSYGAGATAVAGMIKDLSERFLKGANPGAAEAFCNRGCCDQEKGYYRATTVFSAAMDGVILATQRCVVSQRWPVGQRSQPDRTCE